MSNDRLNDSLDDLIDGWQALSGAVGAAFGVVDADHLVWARGIGYADKAAMAPFDTAATILNVGSVSKLITATTILRLVEEGRVRLNDAADGHLDFRVRHPAYPRVPITIHRLLTHTSAIADGPAYRASYVRGDPSLDLGDWLRRYLEPGGDLFDPTTNWHPHRPGKRWAYSNVAFGLLALVAQSASGVPFRQLSQDTVFRLTGMNSSGWLLADVDRGRLATQYCLDTDLAGIGSSLIKRNSVNGTGWHALYQYGFPTFPDGLLRTTLLDLSRFAAAILAAGRDQSGSLLQPQTLQGVFADVMTRHTKPEDQMMRGQGLAWRHFASRRRPEVWGHRGRDPGIRSQIVLDLDAGIGVIAMTNSSAELPEDVDELLDRAERVRRVA